MSQNDFPVVFGICLDGVANWTGKNPDNRRRPGVLSRGMFEIVEGIDPLLNLLDSHAIKATFFVPGQTCDDFPETVRAVAARGHELGSHGYSHRAASLLTHEEERVEIERGLECLKNVAGLRATSYRAASFDWSEHTLQLLLDAGVGISANLQDRVRPYRHQRDGVPVPLVELPAHWHLADYSYFNPVSTIRSAADARQIWEEEFCALLKWPGAFYHLTLHVQLIAHPGRLAMLDQHIRFIKGHPRARFMTCNEVAATVA